MSAFFNWIDSHRFASSIDILFVLYLFFGLIRGVFRGLALELAGLLGSGLIFFGAWRFYIPLSEWLLQNTRLESQETGRLMSYILVVIVGLVLWQVIMLLLKKIFTIAVPSVLQRPGGAVLGLLKCAVILCVLLLAVNLTPFEDTKNTLLQNSAFARFTQHWVPEKIERWFPGLLPEPLRPAEKEPHGSGNA